MKRVLAAAAFCSGFCFAASRREAQYRRRARQVVDDKGQPIEDAKVVIDFPGGVTRKAEAKTNKKGEFTQVGHAARTVPDHRLQGRVRSRASPTCASASATRPRSPS